MPNIRLRPAVEERAFTLYEFQGVFAGPAGRALGEYSPGRRQFRCGQKWLSGEETTPGEAFYVFRKAHGDEENALQCLGRVQRRVAFQAEPNFYE